MPKMSEKHDETDLDKINKIVVETNIKIVSQRNAVAKKYYNSTNFICHENIRHLFYIYNNAKLKGERALEEDQIPDYCSDEDIRKEQTQRNYTLAKLFSSGINTSSSDLKSSINSNKSQQLKKPQIPKSSKSKINQQVTEETSLPMPPSPKKG